MNPTASNSFLEFPAPAPASWHFADEYVAPSPAEQIARANAADLGVVPVSPGAASLITTITRLADVKTAIEIGTGAGVASLAILAGMSSEGVLTSIDMERSHQLAAQEAISDTGVPARRFRLINQTALSVLPRMQDGGYDMVFVDGDQLEYLEYFEQAIRLLRSGGVLMMYHMLCQNQVAQLDNEEDAPVLLREALSAISESQLVTASLLPVGDGLLVVVKH